MDVTQAILSRRSVHKFKSDAISPDDIMEAIDAARHAPSCGNLQAWKFILVKDEKKRLALADAAFQQTWMAQAPVIICVVAMVDEVKRAYGIRGEAVYAIQNCAMASQNLMLRAHELGLGTCYVSAFEEGMVRRILQIPAPMRPQALIPIGYSDDLPGLKLMKSFENVVYFEGYRERVEDWDEAFYRWSGMMRKQVENLFKRLAKPTFSLKERIERKLK